MISVVITAKNAAKTIGTAIRSSLLGLSSEDEILVLLDGCTDDSASKVARISDPRVKVFESTQSLGRSDGRNFLISHAKGDYIAILDADDISLPWRFRRSQKLLQVYDAVFSVAIVFGISLRPFPLIPQVPRRIRSTEMPFECLGRNPLVHSSAMFKREIVQVIGNYRASEAEEYDLWLRMINAGYRLYRTASPWVLYRVHANQASQTPGFVERGSNCSLVQSEQLKLAGTLDLASDNIQEIRSKALAHVSGNGILARLELAGLSNFRSLFSR